MAEQERRRKRGPWVVLLGADGSGKSTVVSALEAGEPAFAGVARFHFSSLAMRLSHDVDVTDPHGRLPRSTLTSVAKCLYWLVEFNLGYWRKVRPLLREDTLVVFDRYLIDVLVDPRRYRYGGPPWLLDVLYRLVPHPDLVLLLDAPADTLIARKQEIDHETLTRLAAGYRALVSKTPRGRIIDASREPARVVEAVRAAISEALA